MAKLYFTLTEETGENIGTIVIDDHEINPNKTFNRWFEKVFMNHFDLLPQEIEKLNYVDAMSGNKIKTYIKDEENVYGIIITQTFLY